MKTKKPVTCFIIDDDKEDQEIFAIAVEEIDSTIQCVSAIDGVEALRKLKEDFTPDFIFLDLNMPRMGGKGNFTRDKEDSSAAPRSRNSIFYILRSAGH